MRQSLKPKERFAILKRDKFRCRYCGADGSTASVQNPVSCGENKIGERLSTTPRHQWD